MAKIIVQEIKSNIMKKFFCLLFTVFLSSVTFAQVNENDITMVSYEQSWMDREGTLALKNNTDKEIHNVSFRITYLDMAGNPLDYEDFEEEVDIAPGMTKKLDISAYERDRHYNYHESEAFPGDSHPFKIKFELKDYNSIIDDDSDEDSDEEISEVIRSVKYANEGLISSFFKASIAIFIFGLFIFGVCVGLYVLVAVMAQNRHRSAVLWIILSILSTPVLAIILLLVLGDSKLSEESQYEK